MSLVISPRIWSPMSTAFTKSSKNGSVVWTAEWCDVRVCFAGIAPDMSRTPSPPCRLPHPSSWLEQCHSAEVLEARPGCAGRGDALYTRSRTLGLRIVTADCLPILLASERTLLGIHAGWRGLAGNIVGAAARVFEGQSRTTAWIGPAIGPCCYEVGPEVATAVLKPSCEALAGKVNLDLIFVAKRQLAAAGLDEIHALDNVCTSCAATELWSYRRDGVAAGRNTAAIWREQS